MVGLWLSNTSLFFVAVIDPMVTSAHWTIELDTTMVFGCPKILKRHLGEFFTLVKLHKLAVIAPEKLTLGDFTIHRDLALSCKVYQLLRRLDLNNDICVCLDLT